MTSFNRIAVVGAGAWGTALTGVAARAGREVVLCVRNAASAAEIAAQRINPRLPGAKLDANVEITGDVGLVAQAEIVLVATPAQSLRAAVTGLAPHLAKATPVIACAKGIERGTHKFMTEVIAEAAPHARPAILSGPSFAEDVARGLPTAVTLAAKDGELARDLVKALGSATFRPYHTTDVRGVEIGGAAKNVLAIAVGIAAGKDSRRLGAGRAHDARLFRTGPLRPRPRGTRGNAGRPVRPRRSDPDLFNFAVAQFRAGACARTRAGTSARPARRGRIHRAGADGIGDLRGHRHAGLECGGRHPAGRFDDRRGDRKPADAPVQGGGVVSRRHASVSRGSSPLPGGEDGSAQAPPLTIASHLPASSSHPSKNFTRSARPEPVPSGATPSSSIAAFIRLTQKVG